MTQPSQHSSSMTRDEFIVILSSISEQLTDVIRTENEMLRQRKYRDLNQIQMEKARLSAAYENQMRLLGEHPSLMIGVPDVQKNHLASIAKKFDEAARENIILLRSACDVNTRILEAIRDAAIEQTQIKKPYGPAAAQNIRRPEQAISVSLDKRL